MDTIQKQRFMTLVVWLISLIISLILYIVVTDMRLIRANAPYDIYVCAFPILAALLWTGLGWRKRSSEQPSVPTNNIQDAPISYKMALLLEMMTDEEREILKQDLRRQVLGSDEAYRLQDMLDDSLILEESSGKRKRG